MPPIISGDSKYPLPFIANECEYIGEDDPALPYTSIVARLVREEREVPKRRLNDLYMMTFEARKKRDHWAEAKSSITLG